MFVAGARTSKQLSSLLFRRYACRNVTQTVQKGRAFTDRPREFPAEWKYRTCLKDYFAQFQGCLDDYKILKFGYVRPAQRSGISKLSSQENNDQKLSNTSFLGSDLQFFREFGILGPKKMSCLTTSETRRLLNEFVTERREFDGLVDSDDKQPDIGYLMHLVWFNSTFLNLGSHPEILTMLKPVLGENIRLVSASVVKKKPVGEMTETERVTARADGGIHSDISSRNLWISDPRVEFQPAARDMVNIWITLTDAHNDGSPLFFVPKSHRMEKIEPKHVSNWVESLGDLEYSKLFNDIMSTPAFSMDRGICTKELINDYLQVQYREKIAQMNVFEAQMKPGEALMFDSHLLHGAFENLSPAPRVAIALRFTKATNSADQHYDFNKHSQYFSEDEQDALGIDVSDKRIPIIQPAGSQCHSDFKPINIQSLQNVLTSRKLSRI